MKRSPIDLAGLGIAADVFVAALLRAVSQPILVVDHEARIRFANAPAAAALGHDGPDDLIGLTVEDRPMLLPRSTGEPATGERARLVRRDGSVMPVAFVAVPLETFGGRGVVVAFTALGERLRAEQERDVALAAQQASLRRVATLVAGGAASSEVFAGIAREVAALLELPFVELSRYEPDGTVSVIGAWSDRPTPFEAGTQWPLDGPSISTRVKETGRPVRVEAYADMPGAIADAARAFGMTSAAGAPIVVDGEVWGVMATCLWDGAPPPDVEDRLAEFAELIAAAFSNTASRDEFTRLADEQAGLRRVATLVAHGVPPAELFGAVAREVGRLLDVDAAHLARYEPDGAATVVAAWSPDQHIAVGTRLSLEGHNIVGLVARTGRPTRLQDYARATGPVAELAKGMGVTSAVGAPIVVDQRLWGVTIAYVRHDGRLPVNAEERISAFSELAATAIANTEARSELARLADEQAALRRVATLVAEGIPADELLGAVTEEAGRLLGADLAGMIRYVAEDSLVPVATWAAEGEHPPVHGTWSLEGDRLATTMRATRCPARVDDWTSIRGPIAEFVRDALGIRASVGCPIIFEGSVWGALVVHSTTQEPLAADVESRLMNFAELVGTAMSNAHARADVDRLAGEQAALRRVATLVAKGASPPDVFAAVAEEVGRLLQVEGGTLYRFETDAVATVVADWGEGEELLPVGTRIALEGENVATRVARTGRSARVDDYDRASGAIGAHARGLGVRSGIGSPVVVDGRLWGALVGVSRQPEPLPPDTEARIGEFTALVATAISNIEARVHLAASRARIVAAADDERRRVARDLHDGAQQRLVHTMLTLKLARQALQPDGLAAELVAEALEQAERAHVELRELVHGLLPAVLARGGLRAGVDTLAGRMALPVEVDIDATVDRMPAPVEATAYYIVAESLTNVAKHAEASCASVQLRLDDGMLRIEVRDDGVGGARTDGSGLVGLADRLAVFNGRLQVDSPAGEGTVVAADLPLPSGEASAYPGWDSADTRP